MISLTNKQRFILNNLLVLATILIGVSFAVAFINMPINQHTSDIARFVFSTIVIVAPLSFFAIVVVGDYKLYNKHGFKYY